MGETSQPEQIIGKVPVHRPLYLFVDFETASQSCHWNAPHLIASGPQRLSKYPWLRRVVCHLIIVSSEHLGA